MFRRKGGRFAVEGNDLPQVMSKDRPGRSFVCIFRRKTSASREETKLRDLSEAQRHGHLVPKALVRWAALALWSKSSCVWWEDFCFPTLCTAPPGKGKAVERCSTPRKGNQLPLTPFFFQSH